MGIVLGVLGWLLLALISGGVAARRGYSFGAYYLHGLFPSFITALITLSIAVRLNRERPLTESVESPKEAPADVHSTAVASSEGQPSTRESIMDSIERLHDLKSKGIITEAEYEEKRKKLLQEI